jgi:predicted TIM-barrel fold metal-dependent hydrolase
MAASTTSKSDSNRWTPAASCTQSYPLPVPGIKGILDADEAMELPKRINNVLYEIYVKAHPDRLGFFASVAMQNPGEAAAELERTVRDLGTKGVLINGLQTSTRTT